MKLLIDAGAVSEMVWKCVYIELVFAVLAGMIQTRPNRAYAASILYAALRCGFPRGCQASVCAIAPTPCARCMRTSLPYC